MAFDESLASRVRAGQEVHECVGRQGFGVCQVAATEVSLLGSKGPRRPFLPWSSVPRAPGYALHARLDSIARRQARLACACH